MSDDGAETVPTRISLFLGTNQVIEGAAGWFVSPLQHDQQEQKHGR